MGIAYCSREDVLSAADSDPGLRAHAQIDRLIQAASRRVERLCHRRFYPETATRYFDWPSDQYAASWRLWLDADELISVTTLTSGGTAVTDYFLEPQRSGPPYTRIEIDLSGPDSFSVGDTTQRAIAVTGVFGYGSDEDTATTLAASVTSSATTISVPNGYAVGVGDLIRVDTERMLVTERVWTDSTQTLAAGVTASKADVTLAVANGALFTAGERLLIGAERMQILDIAGNTLSVARGIDGTTLATHALGVTVYASRTLSVTRAAVGTTAASHSSAATVYVHRPPAPVRELVLAETLNSLQQEGSAYARTVGAGEAMRNASGSALAALREQVYGLYGRTMRTRAV
jgi:hypothetical protein